MHNQCRQKSISSLCVVLFILVCAIHISYGQIIFKDSAKQMDQTNQARRLEMYFEADPLAYANKGYSIHTGFASLQQRIDFTWVHVDFPKSFEKGMYGTDSFDFKTSIYGIKYDYLFRSLMGDHFWYTGLDCNFQIQSFTHRKTGVLKDFSLWYLGPRFGWQWEIGKGFYLTPWTAFWKNLNPKTQWRIDEDSIKPKEWDFLLTFHLGYRFGL